jgi:hypothetical protein
MKHKIPKKIRRAMEDCASVEISESWGGNANGYDVLGFLADIEVEEAKRKLQKVNEKNRPVDNSEDYKIRVCQETGERGTDRLWIATATICGQEFIGCDMIMNQAVWLLLERMEEAE